MSSPGIPALIGAGAGGAVAGKLLQGGGLGVLPLTGIALALFLLIALSAIGAGKLMRWKARRLEQRV